MSAKGTKAKIQERKHKVVSREEWMQLGKNFLNRIMERRNIFSMILSALDPYNLSGSQESRKLNHVCKSFLVSWFRDERFDLVCDTFLDEQSLRLRRCGSSGAQRAEAIGVRAAAGSDRLHHRARSEAFARRTARTSRGKRRQRACHRTRTNSGIAPCCRSSGRAV